MLRGTAVDMLSEQRYDLMTDQIARVAFILIALVFTVRQIPPAQKFLDLIPACPQKRTHIGSGFGADSAQSFDSGTAADIHQECLRIVVCMVCQNDPAVCRGAFKLSLKCPAAHQTSGLFHAEALLFCHRRDILQIDMTTDTSVLAQISDKSFISIRAFSPDTVVDMNHSDIPLPFFFKRQKHFKKAYGVRTARYANDQAIPFLQESVCTDILFSCRDKMIHQSYCTLTSDKKTSPKGRCPSDLGSTY